jgi:hypothetical protein
MSSFVSIGGAAQDRGIPISADGRWVPQQRWPRDQRSALQQRCSHRTCRRVALYQSAHSTNCKIAARGGATTARTICGGRGDESTPMTPSPEGATRLNQTCGGCRVVRGRLQGPITIAWCGTGGDISKEVEVVLLNRGAHAMVRADLAAEAILFSKWPHDLQELLTRTRQAVDPAESPRGGARSRRTRRAGAGGGCPRTHDRVRWRLLKGSEGCVAIHASPR